MPAQKKILLIIGGGIAAYKCLELIRLFKKSGIGCSVILTKAAQQFVTPLSVASLSGEKAYTDLFDLTDETEMGHIQLSRSADLVVVAPATADLMAKMANGHANDLASTALLATDKPVLIVPAMNVRMWQHAATQRNLETLKADGISVLGPDDGDMACGEFGPGRMSEPAAILAAIQDHFGAQTKDQSLKGKKAIVTAGPTHEPIDPVRYIANRSSGKQGYAIAVALAAKGADVVLVSGPTMLAAPEGVTRVSVESANDMLAAVTTALPADIAIFAAAVADWRVDNAAGQKLKKIEGSLPTLTLTENPDILATVCKMGDKTPSLTVGFAAETEKIEQHATEKRIRKGCDWIVANDVGVGTGTFGGDSNKVTVIDGDGVENWPQLTKQQVAEALVARISDHFT